MLALAHAVLLCFCTYHLPSFQLLYQAMDCVTECVTQAGNAVSFVCYVAII